PTVPHTLSVFHADDGTRDPLVTGVQTCALPILQAPRLRPGVIGEGREGRESYDDSGGQERALSHSLSSRKRGLSHTSAFREVAEIGRASCREGGGMSIVIGT